MLTFMLNGKAVEAKEGETVLQVARRHDIRDFPPYAIIPTLRPSAAAGCAWLMLKGHAPR